MMKILVGHNRYQQFGGEDVVVQREVDLLRSQGHEVLLVEFFNKDFNGLSVVSKIRNILSWGWSDRSYDIIRGHCLSFRPDIAHFHNTFFMMTPCVYKACKSLGVPVVQTLHNFRLLCSNALLFRQGKPCEECLGRSLNHSIQYGCYRNSKILTWAVARMTQKHRKHRTWQNEVDAFIVPTHFVGRKHLQEGVIPENKIWIKPHFISEDPGPREKLKDYFVFSGRLSEEKGLMLLLDAFKNLPHIPLVIMGEGPLKESIEQYIKKYQLTHIQLTGFLNKNSYYEILKEAKAVIVPSACYESFGLVIIEAFACGAAVIASRHGSLEGMVQESKTGLLFKPGDSQDLREKITALNESPQAVTAMGLQARQQYEKYFNAQSNYEQLMAIYEQVITHRSSPQ